MSSYTNPRAARRSAQLRFADFRIAYAEPDAHERACRAIEAATRSLRSTPHAIRNMRSRSQQPNPVERVLQVIDRLAGAGAPAADLRAIPLEITAYIESRAERQPLLTLMRDGQEAENAENLAELAALDERAPRALLELAKAKRAEAAVDLEIAAAAEAEADRLQGAR